MKKPKEIPAHEAEPFKVWGNSYNDGLRKMDTYYCENLPDQGELVGIMYSSYGSNAMTSYAMDLLAKALHSRLKQVTDPQPPNQEEEK